MKKYNSINQLMDDGLITDASVSGQIEIEGGGSGSAGIIPITYAELKSKRDAGELVPGQQYRITDYECTTIQENTQSAGHPFDIIVVADDEKTLNENARAVARKTEYLAVSSFKLSMNIPISESEVEREEGVSVASGNIITYLDKDYIEYDDEIKGIIYLPFDNLTPSADDAIIFDSETESYIKLKDTIPEEEWEIVNIEFSDYQYDYITIYFANCNLNAWKLKYCLDNDVDRFAWADENGKGVIYYMKDEWDNECPYDFKNIQFKRKITAGKYDPKGGVDTWVYTFTWINESDNVDDLSIIGQELLNDERQYSGVFGNIIRPISANVKGYPDQPSKFGIALNDIVFISSYGYDGGLFYGCYSNTFGNHCYSNTFGNRCYFNTFGNHCYSNTFGDDCQSNTFGGDCGHNTFGDYYQSNTFGNSCTSNTFGDICRSNTFGNSCTSNTFGDYCSYNTFDNHCYSNTFGNDCSYNIFGGNCSHNTFGDDCHSNTFGQTCHRNAFGDSCSHKHLEYTSNVTDDITGDSAEYWFNGEKKW